MKIGVVFYMNHQYISIYKIEYTYTYKYTYKYNN